MKVYYILNKEVLLILLLTLCKYRTDAKILPLIIGGHYVNISKFPYSARLIIIQIDHNQRNMFQCGSSILNQIVLMTAAHCVPENTGKITAYAGATVYTETTYVRQSSSYLLHEDFKYDTFEADLALLMLSMPFDFEHDFNVKPVNVTSWFPDYTANNFKSVIAGWGATSVDITNMDNTESLHLKCTKQTVLSPEQCSIIVGSENTPGTYCAKNGAVDVPYKGDSGSGLTVCGRKYHQIGVGSFVMYRDDTIVPYYTNVSYYHSWIVSKVGYLLKRYKK